MLILCLLFGYHSIKKQNFMKVPWVCTNLLPRLGQVEPEKLSLIMGMGLDTLIAIKPLVNGLKADRIPGD
jgi:hypothetical protein